jgi:hypothetical protein
MRTLRTGASPVATGRVEGRNPTYPMLEAS